jgi:hypothetical protein
MGKGRGYNQAAEMSATLLHKSQFQHITSGRKLYVSRKKAIQTELPEHGNSTWIKPTINRRTHPRDVPGTEFREKLNLEGKRRSKSIHRAGREAAGVTGGQ